ncbi:30S ribosomal protein S8, partial [Candidatus Pacearchaeota archaeon]|nr:30S ribosomal protein S8 [Candidatus Pacearchaeota archaeon]
MSQDTIADGLNMIKNAKKARKDSVKITRMSNLLIEILK